jgi:hypothetical protein
MAEQAQARGSKASTGKEAGKTNDPQQTRSYEQNKNTSNKASKHRSEQSKQTSRTHKQANPKA